MATKTYIIAFFLILISIQIAAKSDEQQLSEWTQENEKKLIDNNPIIQSKWFEQECLNLAESMQFTQMTQCHLFNSEDINAYVFNNGHVYFSTAMMALINNKHQWASILAHENAHIELQHYLKTLRKIKKPGFLFPKSRIKKLIKKHEQDADEWSKQRLIEFDLKPSQINYFFQRIKDIQGNASISTHLKLSKRMEQNTSIEIINHELIQKIETLN